MRPDTARRFRYTLLAVPLLAVACGKMGAPTKGDIEHVVQDYMAHVNERTSDRSLGLLDGPYDPSDLKITNSDCSEEDNEVYLCTVTALTQKGSHTAQLKLKKVDDRWTIVED